MDTFLTVIEIIISIIAIFFGGKFIIKYVGRDDKSIKIGKRNKIDNSFNNESSFIKKNSKRK